MFKNYTKLKLIN